MTALQAAEPDLNGTSFSRARGSHTTWQRCDEQTCGMTFPNIKNFSVNLTKHMQDLHEEYHGALMSEIKGELDTCPWIGRLYIVKMSALPNMVYRFNTILSKSQQVTLWIATNWF